MFRRLLPLILLTVALLYAPWLPLEPTPEGGTGSGGCIAYGGGYIWCFAPYLNSFYVYQVYGITGWTELDYPTSGIPTGVSAITYESGFNKRIFVVAQTNEAGQLFIYTRNNPNSTEGYWNLNPIYLPTESPDCGPGVSLAYQPVSENGYLRGGFLYLLIGGNTKKFYRRFIADTAVGPRGNMRDDWEPLPDIEIEGGIQEGGAMCYNHNRYNYNQEQDSIYVLIGGGRTEFFSYWTGSRSWNSERPTEQRQWDGSSITSGGSRIGSNQYLYAIFGGDQSHHWKYRINPTWPARWSLVHTLPDWIYPGASITCDQSEENAYLLLARLTPDHNTNFYYDPIPGSDEEQGGSQSVETRSTFQKPKISYHRDRIEIRYEAEAHGRDKVQIYDLLGKRVKTLVSENIGKGERQILWDKTDNSSRKVPYGIYFIAIDKENKLQRVKVIIR